MAYWINEKFQKKFKKEVKPRKHRPLATDVGNLFKVEGEGLHYCNIKSKDNNFVARLIGKLPQWLNKKSDVDLGITHTIAILFSDNLRSWFTDDEWGIVVARWNEYYGGTKELDSSVKALVLASADDDGMNFFDFSKYQTRDFSLRKFPLDEEKQKLIISKLVSIESAPYDVTGLAFWCIYTVCNWFNFLDDPESYFCSELYDIVKDLTGFKIAGRDNPSPLDIENYRLDLRYYVTENFLD